MNLPFPTDTRFIEIMQEVEATRTAMIVHRDVLKLGPFWPAFFGAGGKRYSVKNRYGDVFVSNLTEEHAHEIAQLLNDLQAPE